jgi:hypothetical protein
MQVSRYRPDSFPRACSCQIVNTIANYNISISLPPDTYRRTALSIAYLITSLPI